MPKPTLTALRKHPRAVILVMQDKVDPPDVVLDFEWFDTPEGQEKFWEEVTTYCQEDLETYGDVNHLAVRVDDTASDPITLGEIRAFTTDETFGTVWVDRVKADPTLVIAPPTARKPRAVKNPKPKVRVKPKAKNAAAPSKAEDTPAPKSKSAALKARLADRATVPQDD